MRASRIENEWTRRRSIRRQQEWGVRARHGVNTDRDKYRCDTNSFHPKQSVNTHTHTPRIGNTHIAAIGICQVKSNFNTTCMKIRTARTEKRSHAREPETLCDNLNMCVPLEVQLVCCRFCLLLSVLSDLL